MVNQDVENQVAVAEHVKAPSGTGRARMTIMIGQIKHECNLRPRMTGRYKRRLMEHGAIANERSMHVGLMHLKKSPKNQRPNKALYSPKGNQIVKMHYYDYLGL